MQEGGKRNSPDELTPVSDSGDRVQPTHLRFGKRHSTEYPIDFNLQEGGKRNSPDELTPVSDSGDRVQPTHLRFER
ncbi:hypothetical protein ACZ76_03585 [Yersinia aleksiciae]|uniref:Uncharacterized protein n=1 Tax=Yersinia aleksiciae TaxID=263819 RepID=A0ABN4HEP4_YERAE|nr:hypothetical protein ACZ76_03585 [Yersinia aleksiciae]